MEVKDLIRNKRLELGLTMKELADRVGVSEGTVSRWEAGKISNMKRDKIALLARVLGIQPEEIMEWDENKADDDKYYLNAEARELAQFLFENPEYKILFDASKKVKKEDIQFIKDMMDRMIGND